MLKISPVFLMWILFINVFSAQVLVIPQSQRLAYSGATTDFECISASQLTIQSIEWQINGSRFDDSMFDNIQQALLRLEGSNEIRGGALTFTNTSVEYNTTTIRCIVEYTTGSNETSGITVLLIQDTLDSVELMVFVSENSEIFLNWTAPFTLLGASDITYCVIIADSTNRRTLLSECGTTMTQFTSFLPLSFACEEHSFSVTPVNVVGNGTTSTIVLTNHSSVPMTSPELNEVIPLSTGFLLIMSTPVCNVELTLEDVDTGDTITLEGTDVTITGANITFSTQQLRVKRNYSVTIIASNIAGNATSKTYICINDLMLTTTLSESSNSEPVPVGGIVGIIISTILALVVVAAIVVLCVLRQHFLKRSQTHDEGQQSNSGKESVVDRSKKLKHIAGNVNSKKDLDNGDTIEQLSFSGSSSAVTFQQNHDGALYDNPAILQDGENTLKIQEALASPHQSGVLPEEDALEASSPDGNQVPPKKPDIMSYMELQPYTDSTTQVFEASCHDIPYSTIIGSNNDGQAYAFVDTKKGVMVDSVLKISRAVNDGVKYSVVQTSLQNAPEGQKKDQPQETPSGLLQTPDVLMQQQKN